MDSPPGQPSPESSSDPVPEPKPAPRATVSKRLAGFVRTLGSAAKYGWALVQPHLTRFRDWLSPYRAVWLVLLCLSGPVFVVASLRLLGPVFSWISELPGAGLVFWSVAGLAGVVIALLRLRPRRTPESAERTAPRKPLPLPVLIALVIVAVSAAVGLIIAGTWWAMGARVPTTPDEFTVGHLNAISVRAFAIVAGLGATALLVINYRRQVTTEAESERQELKLFDERFTNAYTELGSEHPAVRLGAVYALANLADDAPKNREDLVQTVIDILCAYIRMPYSPEPKEPREGESAAAKERYRELKQQFDSMREVRHTILRIIGDRLRKDTRWRGKDYDFSGAVIDGLDFRGAHFTSSTVDFAHAHFTSGNVDFSNTRFKGGSVIFSAADFAGARVNFSAASGEAPEGLLESVSNSTTDRVILPREWRDAGTV
ncbi:pentapeptide repeat-containing protein [Nocardiopsis ganjiahuensis]|uniref:pentapeptide repeat-containing protein n=1 Tax=Nocardiopsis ganjiahuensis TaxID=239984 RepID=UPI0007C64497|nr:pentapeptide repeat-containing protein [Nocardiopsis ganjiahuensis]